LVELLDVEPMDTEGQLHICIQIYYKIVAYAIMEAEKSKDMLSARWRISQIQKPKNQENQECKVQLRAEDCCPGSRSWQAEFPLT
jgi:hypothetical protein